MKKLIITTGAIVALTCVACKKDNVQPTTNSTTNIEQVNNETETNDDKAVDARNKFIGTWKGTSFGTTSAYGYSQSGANFKYTITKYGSSKLKIIVTLIVFGESSQSIYYGSVIGSNKMQLMATWKGVATECDAPTVSIIGNKSTSNVNKINMVYESGECDYFRAVATVTKQ